MVMDAVMGGKSTGRGSSNWYGTGLVLSGTINTNGELQVTSYK